MPVLYFFWPLTVTLGYITVQNITLQYIDSKSPMKEKSYLINVYTTLYRTKDQNLGITKKYVVFSMEKKNS